jgi:enediyne polyketide synthase
MISIIGISCIYPDANSPQELWNNIISKKRSFRKIPKSRLDLSYYDNKSNDSIYIKEAALIKNYAFDRKKFKISDSIYYSADLTHWLALDVSYRALADAGFVNGNGLNKEKTGVIVGNTLTGEFSRSELMRLRWPYVQRLLESQLKDLNLTPKQTVDFIDKFESMYKSPFVEPNEDTLSGGLSNTIAGRICNYFNFNGGGFTVDGACSSSLIAINQACNLLENHALDYALVGGVDLSLDPFELIGFSRISAMSHGTMKVYDKFSDGFLPGEGCGFLLLTRTEEIKNTHIKKYCDIIGWGVSSDGSGGLTRPEIGGQQLAINRACEKANININEVTLFEGHGTGTVVGDNVELSALNRLLERSDNKHYIGSVKTNIGHTKAAAGVAGVIKSIMALNHQIIPPITAQEIPNDQLLNNSGLRTTQKALTWPENSRLTSGISSFGFGGINSHIILENKNDINIKQPLNVDSLKNIKNYQDYELFIFSENSKEKLLDNLNNILINYSGMSFSEMSHLSYDLFKKYDKNNQYKLVLVCNYPKDLIDKIKQAINHIDNKDTILINNSGIYFSNKLNIVKKPVFIFPGQASPVRFNFGIYEQRFNNTTKNYEHIHGDSLDTSIAQQSIILNELLAYKILIDFNIYPEIMIGHSLGELMCLYGSEMIDEKLLLHITNARGNIMQKYSKPGSMIVIWCDTYQAIPLLEEFNNIDIAGYNTSNQIVLSVPNDSLDLLINKLNSQKIKYSKLPVNRMFHSRYMNEAAKEWKEYLNRIYGSLKTPMKIYISSVSGELVINKETAISLLQSQFTKPVLFTKCINELDDSYLFLEIGPGNIITGLLSNDNKNCVSIDMSSNSIFGLLCVLGFCCIHNIDVNLDILFDRDYNNIFDPINDSFFVNSCEANTQVAQTINTKTEKLENLSSMNTIDIVKSCIAKKTNLNNEDIKNDFNFLKDLHLNSISVGQIVSDCCSLLDIKISIPLSEFSNKTVEETAIFLDNITKSDNDPKYKIIEGVDYWVRAFSVDKKLTSIKHPHTQHILETEHLWSIETIEQDANIEKLQELSNSLNSTGVILYINNNNYSKILECIHKIIKQNIKNIIVIQHSGYYNSFFKTLHKEYNDLKILLIDIPKNNIQINYIIDEFNSCKNYSYVIYDKNYNRYEENIDPIINNVNDNFTLTNEDIIVVSGGAKGITHECCKELAKKYKCQLAILGRSEQKYVQNNLDNLTKYNIKHKYYVCDVSNLDEARDCINHIIKDFGKIDGLIHGAGINSPCLMANLSSDQLIKTIQPKVHGLSNLIETITSNNKLKLLVNFSSIIGRLGMAGQADYALSNAITSDMVVVFKEKHQDTKCLSLEWSVWSDVGMGANLGKIESLANNGIYPITIEYGTEIFLSLLEQKIYSPIIPIISRLGDVSEFSSINELPFLRFLEKIKVFYPNIELVSECNVSIDSDHYLKDHIINNEIILPAVMMIEGIIQCCSALTGLNFISKITNLEFKQPIIVNKSTTIRFCCLRKENKIHISIRCKDTMFKVDHFNCVVELNSESIDNIKDITKVIDQNISVDTIYNSLLFQKGSFAKIDKFLNLSAYESCSQISTNDSIMYFDRSLPVELLTGDPGSRDSCLHSIQCCVPNVVLLPHSVQSISMMNALYNGKKLAHSIMKYENDDSYCYDLIITDTNYNILEIWNNIVFKKLENKKYDKWNKDLLCCYIKRNLSKNSNIKIHFSCNDSKENGYRSDGKPNNYGLYTSRSYTKNLCFIVSDSHEVSCDIECVSTENSHKILNDQFHDLYEALVNTSSEDSNTLVTLVWSVIECIKKAGLSLNQPVTILKTDYNKIIFSLGNKFIYSFIEQILDIDEKICISILDYE